MVLGLERCAGWLVLTTADLRAAHEQLAVVLRPLHSPPDTFSPRKADCLLADGAATHPSLGHRLTSPEAVRQMTDSTPLETIARAEPMSEELRL